MASYLDYLNPWCWTIETKCPDSSITKLYEYALQEYLMGASGKSYEYGFYWEESGMGDWLIADGSHDIKTRSASDPLTPVNGTNGLFEIYCLTLVANTLKANGPWRLELYPVSESKLDLYFDPVWYGRIYDLNEAGPGDIIYWRTKVGQTSEHVAFLANQPHQLSDGTWSVIEFGAENFKRNVDWSGFNISSNGSSGNYFVQIYRPKIWRFRFICEPPNRPPDHALYQYHGDPLMLDLDGAGIQTVGLDAGVHFDHDDNGFKELTGWVSPGDGMLMLDKNGNGLLDDGSELFGDSTILPDGTKASNGFQALEYYDANHDGKIDANDPVWQQLRIWQPDTYVLPQGYG